MNYDRFALLENEITEAKRMKRLCPFRDWHVVKPEIGETLYVDSKRKAARLAKQHAPAAIYKVG